MTVVSVSHDPDDAQYASQLIHLSDGTPLQTVHAGARVSITLVNGRRVTFTVAGIYDSQFPQSDSNAYITTNEAGKLLPASRDRATAIYVRTRSGVNVSQEFSRLAALRCAAA